ncbi:MAG: EamA family transporter [SAR202 cluster bacterium]|jgi:transporter family protein|nr:EamA family transporter [SAR202 cluster bacterium]MDP6511738.1 EamA family transporter [SAR202 cluster bacterium]MDP6713917.1 EamA family transporter [SAR202 cluster bacterium]
MSYTGWAVLAMAVYGVNAVLLKLALRQVPAEVALAVTNTVLVAAGFALVVFRGQSIVAHLSFGWPTVYLGLAGVTLTVGVVAFYTALSRGPASVVVPIFAMNFAVASLLGVVLLGEGMTIQRGFGLLLAVGSIILLTR